MRPMGGNYSLDGKPLTLELGLGARKLDGGQRVGHASSQPRFWPNRSALHGELTVHVRVSAQSNGFDA